MKIIQPKISRKHMKDLELFDPLATDTLFAGVLLAFLIALEILLWWPSDYEQSVKNMLLGQTAIFFGLFLIIQDWFSSASKHKTNILSYIRKRIIFMRITEVSWWHYNVYRDEPTQDELQSDMKFLKRMYTLKDVQNFNSGRYMQEVLRIEKHLTYDGEQDEDDS